MLTEEIVALSFPSRIASIAEATARAVEVAAARGFDEDAIFGIDMAVREAVTNAVIHGNREDESKSVDIKIADTSEGLTISVRDCGAGFDPDAVPDPTAAANLMGTSGRGILFMRNFMDAVEWTSHTEGGTIVRMTKRRAVA